MSSRDEVNNAPAGTYFGSNITLWCKLEGGGGRYIWSRGVGIRKERVCVALLDSQSWVGRIRRIPDNLTPAIDMLIAHRAEPQLRKLLERFASGDLT